MKTVKSLLLGSAAGFAALTGAQAADLPMAEPVEYVKICSTYGEGFFYIPGTDTCLQISGKVRVEGYIHFNGSNTDSVIGLEDDDDFTTKARGVLGLDARTETEWGTLRSYIEWEANNDSGGPNLDDGIYDDGAVGIEMISGFVQFAGITAGFAPSFYDFAETDTFADFWSHEDVWTVAYTASFGSGFAATIGVEDKYDRANPVENPDLALPAGDANSDLDQVWPNVVAALRVDQAWGSAQISGAIQDNEGDRPDYAIDPFPVEDEIGFAVQGAAKFNLPIAEEGSYFLVQGAYSEGATSYAAGEEDWLNDFLGGVTDQSIVAGAAENNELWTVGASVGIQASETVRMSVTAAYYEFDDADPAGTDFDSIFAEGNVTWTPVDNLDLSLFVLYGEVDPDVGADSSDLRLVTRIERNF